MKKRREIKWHLEFHLGEFPRVPLTTARPLSEELFSSLHYISEIEEIGLKFLDDLGYTKLSLQEKSRLYLLFQSFVRQGKAFFEGAEKLEYRASPLFYYYSFLNLVKAYLCLKNPDMFGKRIHHGLIHEHKETKFGTQSVLVKPDGVFPFFYEDLVGAKMPTNISLNIVDLLAYVPDINYEYMLVKYGTSKLLLGNSRVCLNFNQKKAWPVISLGGVDSLYKYGDFFKPFHNYFEEISLESLKGPLANELFEIYAERLPSHKFFQSKKEYDFTKEGNIPRSEILKDCLAFMKNYCMPTSMKMDHDFFIFLPLESDKDSQIFFNDTLASYVIMFYLGSLVRYFPSYLEGLLNSKHAWIIEAFTKSVGFQFLRNITNLIVRKNLVFSSY